LQCSKLREAPDPIAPAAGLLLRLVFCALKLTSLNIRPLCIGVGVARCDLGVPEAVVSNTEASDVLTNKEAGDVLRLICLLAQKRKPGRPVAWLGVDAPGGGSARDGLALVVNAIGGAKPVSM
jgi:hypothetical protein